jgi:hypothetical protein
MGYASKQFSYLGYAIRGLVIPVIDTCLLVGLCANAHEPLWGMLQNNSVTLDMLSEVIVFL